MTNADDARRALSRFAVGEIQIAGRKLTAPVSGGAEPLTEMLSGFQAGGVKLHDVALRRPSLDDVFLSLTGHNASKKAPSRWKRWPDGAVRLRIWRRPECREAQCDQDPPRTGDPGRVLVTPVIMVVMFAYVFGGSIDVAGGSSREFLVAGAFALSSVFGATFTGAGLADDIQKRIIDHCRIRPCIR
ncbi:MAG TPA: hypothetical protein VF148_06160 [Acidimicrobiia bacterium]